MLKYRGRKVDPQHRQPPLRTRRGSYLHHYVSVTDALIRFARNASQTVTHIASIVRSKEKLMSDRSTKKVHGNTDFDIIIAGGN